ncbi:hypothetical protein JOC54_001093 [Alkalihalobacillus xiaoxiensis]|uniref:Uncharacterized protein n=1 Tax=Shouchella xiaoxiensis TaxID=766895 RepID=A0ABS2SQR3_9BACI|nr:hypothetical protein [Shouchella xiaoxiensis]MBM7837862.1 hypothetical protein [Shouchella xiaoxiensis]
MNNLPSDQTITTNTLIGRMFTLGGSALFLTGSFIAVYAGYQAYIKTLE